MRWLVLFVAVALVACGVEQDRAHPLDAPGRRACASFEDLTGRFDSLARQQRVDLALEIWENAQFSRTPGIKRIGRQVLKVVVQQREFVRDLTFREMRLACVGRARGRRFAREGVLCSKLDGGAWAIEKRIGDRVTIQAALRRQAGSDEDVDAAAAASFVEGVRAELAR